jgi:deoxycytidylate deaminase
MKTGEDWFTEAEKIAQDALCKRAKCGAVIVLDGKVIGRGYNAPPQNDVTHAKCSDGEYDRAKKPKYDLTCCIHAEWRAIADALKNHPKEIQGSTLYYVRLDEEGSIHPSGEPFCTVCSRLAIDVGIAKFGLMHQGGPKLYHTNEYNNLSYDYHKK